MPCWPSTAACSAPFAAASSAVLFGNLGLALDGEHTTHTHTSRASSPNMRAGMDAEVALSRLLTALGAINVCLVLLVVRRLRTIRQAIACHRSGGDDGKRGPARTDALRTPPLVQELSTDTPLTVAVGGEPTRFDNDVFAGSIVFFAKGCPGGEALESSGRLWELQVQGRFKRDVSRFYLGLEISRPLKGIGMVKRSLANLLLGIIKQWYKANGGGELHASLGDLDGGGGELPHLCSPFFSAVDEVWATPPGGTPPQLGAGLLPTDAETSGRGSRSTAMRADSTYTFVYFSTNVDLSEWAVVLPGRKVDLAPLLGQASMRIAAYTLENEDDARHPGSVATTPTKRYFFQGNISPPPHVVSPPESVQGDGGQPPRRAGDVRRPRRRSR